MENKGRHYLLLLLLLLAALYVPVLCHLYLYQSPASQ